MIADVLNEDLAICNLDASTGEDVIAALVERICANGEVEDCAQAKADVLANEQRSSTGMQHGVAIPHAKTRAVSRLHAAVAVTREPIDFDSLDGQPCRIFVMTLSPPDRAGPHMKFLAEVGRLLKSRQIRRAILAARTPAELLRAFGSPS
ncbi:MAG: PTS sugar transporter subunit IIA [Spirochaetota bacterium]